MKVLFTAVGGSDPIKRMLDGPMLHCLRVYEPDVVYMYFTKEMLAYETKDNRYTWAVQKLGEKLGHKFEIKKIERPELVEVQKFDTFYDDFESVFDEIENEYPDAELYANASSGTPAMKSGLVITAAMSKRRINVIQVSSGEKHPMHDRDKDETYDKEEQWEFDIDNGETFTDRTSIVESDRFLVKVKKANIQKYIFAYDYNAALNMAREVSEFIPPDVLKLISAAVMRLRLDYNGVLKELSGTGYDIIPVKDDKKRSITEYMLWLGIVLKKGDYLSFIRGITPIAMTLMETAVEKATPIGNIRNYCDKNNEHYILTTANMQKSELGNRMLDALNKEFRSGYKDSEYTTAQLKVFIKEFCEDKDICEYAVTIRNAEYELRNQAAHTIIAVDNNIIKRRIGITAEELYNVIKKMGVKLNIISNKLWNSYDEMNELILDNLK